MTQAATVSVHTAPSISVFGAGAVGLHVVAALDKAGLGANRLSLVCRGAAYEHIKNTGSYFNFSELQAYILLSGTALYAIHVDVAVN
jgi:ketopantoate reductase